MGDARLDFTDPAARTAWLRDVWKQVSDACAAGEDATRAPGARDLGRREARRIIVEATENLTALFEAAGIDPAEPDVVPPMRAPGALDKTPVE
jgi:hypothetical protein